MIKLLAHNDVVGLNLPTGYGKSYLARAWQLFYGNTDIITPSNLLVNQYHRDYPELNVVKGKTHYETPEAYERAKQLAWDSQDSVFNPLSALFTRLRQNSPVRCIIVDEAHTLGEMLRTAATASFNTSKSNIPQRVTSEYGLSVWAKERFLALDAQVKSTAAPSNQLMDEFERVGAVYYSINGQETKSVFQVNRSKRVFRGRKSETVTVDAVECPIGLLRQVLRADKIILMSGTLTQDETALLAHGRKHTWLTEPYLAPAKNRPVYIEPVDREKRRDVPTLAREVRRIYEQEGRRPTLVHVSYADSYAYAQELQDLIPLVNTSSTKDLMETCFRRDGGLWIASGCAEGIDLADDACRVVIVPSLLFPNKGDLHVQKRLGLPGGQRWYSLKTLENTIQRLGRGMRHSEDHCKSFILDPLFPSLWTQYSNQFEKLAIHWDTK